ncbi:high affinity copper uptake protein 1 isoform X2 [Onthophagus taurus]|uniref:high affinity copper uptake protein 1 isoform X2 n=1 Tax=Onthophagus taurus TaxID=166361 RepID=UPI0039BE10BD
MAHDHHAHHHMEPSIPSAIPMEHDDHSGHPDGSMGHGMSMAFHFGISETVLFESWAFSTTWGLIGSMIGIFFMAALYEGLKYYREYLFWRTYNALQYRAVTLQQDKAVVSEDNQIVQPSMLSLMHVCQTGLHIIQIVLSYFLMLIFMTYNVWLCIAVVVGAAVGYFLFGWKKSVIVDVTEHCH